MKNFHPFHIVDQSPWPIISGVGALTMTYGLIYMFNNNSAKLLFLGSLIILLTMLQWWRDVTRESTFQGRHTHLVTNGLRYGMILFISSEVLFFIS